MFPSFVIKQNVCYVTFRQLMQVRTSIGL